MEMNNHRDSANDSPILERSEILRHPGLTPHSHHGGGGRWTILGGPPKYGPGSDSAESYRPQPYSEDRHAEVDSAGSYDPYMDFHEGYTDYGEYGECRDISLRSDLGFDYGEDSSMEVEEVLYGDPPNGSDVESADSESDEALALQIPPKANHPKLHKEGRRCSRTLFPLGCTAPELVHRYLSLVEAKGRRHQCSPQRQAKQLLDSKPESRLRQVRPRTWEHWLDPSVNDMDDAILVVTTQGLRPLSTEPMQFLNMSFL
ncbi:hypothetical protein P4O66_002236 [Electrophorus voltai]|uniref:Uncharacterized protein n=1 Tax=Electrophorus voltai TaxID=2609070 RepID=A0AAD8YZL1_9TELE|nr:hypothetical protein P4O66_002236 [Electrophorus voltai]